MNKTLRNATMKRSEMGNFKNENLFKANYTRKKNDLFLKLIYTK